MTLDTPAVRDCCDRLARPYWHAPSGAIVAVATRRGELFRAYGHVSRDQPRPATPETLFEIGSITKVFTSILLARLALTGRIDLDAPIGRIRPEFAGAPDWITPRTLATHTSGLPRLPFPLWRALFMSDVNPYADFHESDLVAWMARHRPSARPKTGTATYSNLGVGLLGYVLARICGGDYENSLRTEVLTPLGLHDTAVRLDDDMRKRLATPHTGRGRPTPPWDFDALAGAGSLRSTARDLVTFSRAVMAAPKGQGPLDAALARSLEIELHGRVPGAPDQCLGWGRIRPAENDPSFFVHDGGTRGSTATLLVSPTAGVAMVLLSNTGGTWKQMLAQIRSDPNKILSDLVSHTREATAAPLYG